MFGEMTFAGGTFSDLFPAVTPVIYIYRSGRTAVYVYPEDEQIVTGVSSIKLATKVEAVEAEESTSFVLPTIKLRSKVELYDDSEIPTLIKPDIIIRTKVEAIPLDSESAVQSHENRLRTRVEAIVDESSSVENVTFSKSQVKPASRNN